MSRLSDKISKLNKSETAGFSFSMTAIFYVFFAFVFSIAISGLSGEARGEDWYFYLSYLIPSLVLTISLITLFRLTPYSFSDFSSIKFEPKFLLPTVLIFAGAYLSLSEINDIFVEFLSRFGYEDSTLTLPKFSVFGFILCLIIIGIIPPILEEMLFRGVILGGNKGNAILSIVISALCFSVYHMSPSKTIYQLIMGALFAIVAYKTRGILPTVIIHVLNNVAVLVMYYFFPALEISATAKTIMIIGGAALLAAGIVLLFVLSKDKGKVKNADNGSIGGFFAWASVGLALCLILWVSRFFV